MAVKRHKTAHKQKCLIAGEDWTERNLKVCGAAQVLREPPVRYGYACPTRR
jgi:hypothetical protein